MSKNAWICQDHPTVLQPPRARVCAACSRPLDSYLKGLSDADLVNVLLNSSEGPSDEDIMDVIEFVRTEEAKKSTASPYRDNAPPPPLPPEEVFAICAAPLRRLSTNDRKRVLTSLEIFFRENNNG